MQLDDVDYESLTHIFSFIVKLNNIKMLQHAFASCKNISEVLITYDRRRIIEPLSFHDMVNLVDIQRKPLSLAEYIKNREITFTISHKLLEENTLWNKRNNVLKVIQTFKNDTSPHSDLVCKLTNRPTRRMRLIKSIPAKTHISGILIYIM